MTDLRGTNISGDHDTPPEPQQESADFDYHNPWTHLWLHPRATIRQMASIEDDKAVFWVPACIALIYTLPAGTALFPVHIGLGLGVAVSGLLLGPVFLGIAAFLNRVVGRLFGGQADTSDLKTALAWGQVPMLLPFVVGTLALVFNLQNMNHPSPLLEALTGALSVMMAFLPPIIFVLAGIYTLAGVSEVQGFGIVKTIFSMMMANFFVVMIGYIFFIGVTVAMIPAAVNYFQKTQSMSSPPGQQVTSVPWLVPADEHTGEDFDAYEWIKTLELVREYQKLTNKKVHKPAESLTEEDIANLQAEIDTVKAAAKAEKEDSAASRSSPLGEEVDATAGVAVVAVEEPAAEPVPVEKPPFDPTSLTGYTGNVEILLKDGSRREGLLLDAAPGELMIESGGAIQNVGVEAIEDVHKKS